MMRAFRFYKELFEFCIQYDKNFKYENKAVVLLNSIINYNLNHGLNTYIEFYYQTFLNKFGLTQKNIDFLNNRFRTEEEIQNQHRQAIEKFRE